MESIKSGMMSLNQNDFVRGACVAVATALFVPLYALVSQQGFDAFTVDWNALLHLEVNGVITAFVSYIAVKFFSNDKGEVLGMAG